MATAVSRRKSSSKGEERQGQTSAEESWTAIEKADFANGHFETDLGDLVYTTQKIYRVEVGLEANVAYAPDSPLFVERRSPSSLPRTDEIGGGSSPIPVEYDAPRGPGDISAEPMSVRIIRPYWAMSSICLSVAMLTALICLALTARLGGPTALFMLVFSLGLGTSSLGMLITAKPRCACERA